MIARAFRLAGRLMALAVAMALMPGVEGTADAAGFPRDKARTRVERMIWADPALSRADDALAAA
jgi:hypothetical protein